MSDLEQLNLLMMSCRTLTFGSCGQAVLTSLVTELLKVNLRYKAASVLILRIRKLLQAMYCYQRLARSKFLMPQASLELVKNSL